MHIEKCRDGQKLQLPESVTGITVSHMLDVARVAAESGVQNLTLDFSGTRFIDSACISALVSLTRLFKEKNATLWLERLNDDLLELLDLTGIGQLLNINVREVCEEATLDLYDEPDLVRINVMPKTGGDVCVVQCSGRMIYPLGSHCFRRAVVEAMGKADKIVLACEELSHVDSGCISIIVQMALLLKRTGGEMRIAALNPILRDTFERLGAGTFARLYENSETAMKA